MSALEILRDHNLTSEDHFSYETREIDNRFSAVEIWRSGDKPVLFREFFFVIDTIDEKVYLADFQVPESVFIVKIQRGSMTPISKDSKTAKLA